MNEKAKKITVTIEEYANVDETFKNIKNIKVGTMVLNDLFGDNLKVIENALEERKELLKWKDSQQDLIKGKDEYIAKLCNDRAELKEENKHLKEARDDLTKDMAKYSIEAREKLKELSDLREFARIINEKEIDIWLLMNCDYDNYCRIRTKALEANMQFLDDMNKRESVPLPTIIEFNFVKKVVSKYAKE